MGHIKVETNPLSIDWHSSDSSLFLNPRLEPRTFRELSQLAIQFDFPGHIWIASSGSKKLVALSKQAMLASAAAVNEHLQVTIQDKWGLVLPRFHVGGLSIEARASLSHSSVLDSVWDTQTFINWVEQNEISLLSLVPTQVFDLVKQGLRAPSVVRAVVVGGSALSENLFQQARALGWPLLPSYGMTECCSQVATAELESLKHKQFPLFKILPHLKVNCDSQGVLSISGKSMMSGYAHYESGIPQWVERRKDESFQTQDVGELFGGKLRILGRQDDLVKVLGEGVSLQSLRDHLEAARISAAIAGVPDARLGTRLVAVIEADQNVEEIHLELINFNRTLAPFERILELVVVDKIPRTELGKIKLDSALLAKSNKRILI